MKFSIRIAADGGRYGEVFDFHAATPEAAAREVAADSDYEPWQVVEVEISDSWGVHVFEVRTRPPYEPVRRDST